MYRRFINARSPLRLLEKGLHGGLGSGNLGIVLAGRGVGKTSFLVGVALDELLRSEKVLHIALDDSVSHVREHYDTVFEELAASTHLQDGTQVHQDIDGLRSIRAFPGFEPDRLRSAVEIERQTSGAPATVVVDGLDVSAVDEALLKELKAIAEGLEGEVWVAMSCPQEQIGDIPDPLGALGEFVSVVLSLEPAGESVRLRALKDHENPDVEALHVALDPRTMLLTRSS